MDMEYKINQFTRQDSLGVWSGLELEQESRKKSEGRKCPRYDYRTQTVDSVYLFPKLTWECQLIN